MSYLVVFGTFDGHSAKLARAIGEQIRASADVQLMDAEDGRIDPNLSDQDGCIIVAPVHQQRHPESVVSFAKAHASQLNAIRTALVSVSLSAAFDDGRPEAQSYVDRLLETTGWQPDSVHLAAGALSYTKYDFFQEQIIRHVVLKGRAPDQIEGDHEFTDMKALAEFVDGFVADA